MLRGSCGRGTRTGRPQAWHPGESASATSTISSALGSMTARGAAEAACPVMLSSGWRRGQVDSPSKTSPRFPTFLLRTFSSRLSPAASGQKLQTVLRHAEGRGCRTRFGKGEAEMREQRRGGPAGEARHSARRSRSRSRGRNCAGERDFRHRRSRDWRRRWSPDDRGDRNRRSRSRDRHRRWHSPDDRSGRGQSRGDHDRNTRDERRHSTSRRRSRSRSWDRERHHHGVASSFRHEPAHAGRGGRRGDGGQGAARNCIELNKQITKSGATRELCTLIEAHSPAFNHVNIATAFRKLLQAPRAGMPRGVVEHSLKRWNSGRCRQCKTLGRSRFPARYT